MLIDGYYKHYKSNLCWIVLSMQELYKNWYINQETSLLQPALYVTSIIIQHKKPKGTVKSKVLRFWKHTAMLPMVR